MALVVCVGLAALVVSFIVWGISTFQVSFDAVVATLTGPLEGTGGGMLQSALLAIVPPTVAVTLAAALLVAWLRRRARRAAEARPVEEPVLRQVLWTRRGLAGAAAAAVTAGLWAGDRHFGLTDYVGKGMEETDIYRQCNVDPRTAGIKAPARPKNLVMLYLESMETTYASVEDGGAQQVNHIPRLTELARQNVSFSNSEALGGSRPVVGTTWTIGSLVSSTSGLPFRFPVENGNDTYAGMDQFASGMYNLGDFLEDQGYVQEFMCGSDATFGGRRNYFKNHGNYRFFDLFEAKDRQLIPEDYYVWWGFEDAKLYEWAKDEVTALAAEGQPFNFTMLAVDTHHVDGYRCQLCPDHNGNTTADVVECADSQAANFIAWLQEQPFFEDTLLVVLGDHPRMDSNLVEGVEFLDRTAYNCFVNGPAVDEKRQKNREFTPMDMFPTIVSALGFDVPGSRLGIGTDLASGKPTLAEELGYQALNDELSKNSTWFAETFSPELAGVGQEDAEQV